MAIPQEVRQLYAAFINSRLIRHGVLPASADGVADVAITIAAAAVAWTFGAYTQIVAAAGITQDTRITGFTLENFVGAAAQGEVEIAIGAGGLEVTIGTYPLGLASSVLPKPLFVPNATRVSARYRTSTGVADTVDIKLTTETGSQQA